MAKDNQSRLGNGILGDIDPAPEPEAPRSGEPIRKDESDDESSMVGGSRDDRSKHPGSRDATDGVKQRNG